MSEKSVHEDIEIVGEEVEKERKELPYLFEKELYNNSNKRIHIHSEYIQSEKAIPVEGKFYSKYEENWLHESQLSYQKYYKLTQLLSRLPMEKYKIPILESQCYGWMPTNSQYELNRSHAPKIRCDLTIYDEKLRCERITERPKYSGEKFILD